MKKRNSNGDAFGWLFFFLLVATLCSTTSSEVETSFFCPRNVDFSKGVGVGDRFDRNLTQPNGGYALVETSFSEIFCSKVARSSFSPSFRFSRSRTSAKSDSFKTASNRLAFERNGLSAFLFKEFWTSRTLIDPPLYLLLLSLLN